VVWCDHDYRRAEDVEIRGRLMEKLQARALPDLVRLVLAAEPVKASHT
jgi:hypothetical protein